jgi:hypothetical protein
LTTPRDRITPADRENVGYVGDTIPSRHRSDCGRTFLALLAIGRDDQPIRKKRKVKGQALDNLLDALVWMRRKAKQRQPVDDLIAELINMRRKAKKKAAKRNGKRLKPRNLKPK